MISAKSSCFETTVCLGDVVGDVSLTTDEAGLIQIVNSLFEVSDKINPCNKQITFNSLEELDKQLDAVIRSTATRQLASVHSSAVSINNRGIAIMGLSHTGKTTLGLACAHAGLSYLGDEYGFWDFRTGLFSQAKYPLCLRKGTLDALKLEIPPETPALNRTEDEKTYLVPMRFFNFTKDESNSMPPLGAIVVPCRDAQSQEFCLEPITISDWPKEILPSIDAKCSRVELFSQLLKLCSQLEIKIWKAKYHDIKDGVNLVKQAAMYFA